MKTYPSITKMMRSFFFFIFSLAISGGIFIPFTAYAADPQWSGSVDSAWGDGENWSPEGVPLNNADLVFGSASGYTVDLGGGTRLVGNLVFQNGKDYTIQNGILQLDASKGIDATLGGAISIYADVSLSGSAPSIHGEVSLMGKLEAATVYAYGSDDPDHTILITGSSENKITSSFAIVGGTVIVDKSSGTAAAQKSAISSNLTFAGGGVNQKLIYQNQEGYLGRIVLQRSGVIEAEEGFTLSGVGAGNYLRFDNPGYKLTLNTFENEAHISTWVEFSNNKSGSIELETLSAVNFDQDGRGIRNSLDGFSTLSFIKSGSGKLTYAATVVNSYTGSTTIKEGILSMGNMAQLGSSTAAAANLVFSGGTLEYTGSTATSARGFTVQTGSSTIDVSNSLTTLTLSGDIAGGGELVKKGAGTLLLSGNGSGKSGSTKITAGSLVLDGTLGGTTKVSDTGTIAGNGSVNGLTIASGGTLSPGHSPGTLYGTGGATWEANGNYNWQVASLNTDPEDQSLAGDPNGWDLFSVTGVLNLDGLDEVSDKFNLNLWTLSSTDPDVSGAIAGFDLSTIYIWKIVEATEIQINGFTVSSNTDYSSYFQIQTAAINGTDGWAGGVSSSHFRIVTLDGTDALYLQTIPEPSTILLVLSLAGLFILRRFYRFSS